ncbi:ATP-binding cassette domain-containing protein [Nonomuraea sp. NPDC059194]|uniref:ATP-binding cassette domain-containing protein n=1 Tax=Nonomuraea sp. NPDC059194 TaxID=3346764 RepID=UPI0036CFDFF9
MRGWRRASRTLGPVDLEIGWTERVAITGANGSGKTTLLAAMLGKLKLERAMRRSVPGWWSARSFEGSAPLVESFSDEMPPGEVRTLPRWRCCRPGASTCWCSTSRPTTSTCPRSSSWSRRWRPIPARCCWSPTTGGCSMPYRWIGGCGWTEVKSPKRGEK